RPSDNLPALVQFYRDGLGLDILFEFKGHDGFDGVMLGAKGAAFHLEFTRKVGHKAGRAPTEDNLWFFMCLTAKRGNVRWPGWKRKAISRSRRSIRIGTRREKHSRIRTAIAWCYRM